MSDECVYVVNIGVMVRAPSRQEAEEAVGFIATQHYSEQHGSGYVMSAAVTSSRHDRGHVGCRLAEGGE